MRAYRAADSCSPRADPLNEVLQQQAAAPRPPRPARPYRADAVRPNTPDLPRWPGRRAHRGLQAPLGHPGCCCVCVAAHSRAAGTQSGCAADRDERRGARSSSLATCAARRVAAFRRAARQYETGRGRCAVRGLLNGTRRRCAATSACNEPTRCDHRRRPGALQRGRSREACVRTQSACGPSLRLKTAVAVCVWLAVACLWAGPHAQVCSRKGLAV